MLTLVTGEISSTLLVVWHFISCDSYKQNLIVKVLTSMIVKSVYKITYTFIIIIIMIIVMIIIYIMIIFTIVIMMVNSNFMRMIATSKYNSDNENNEENKSTIDIIIILHRTRNIGTRSIIWAKSRDVRTRNIFWIEPEMWFELDRDGALFFSSNNLFLLASLSFDTGEQFFLLLFFYILMRRMKNANDMHRSRNMIWIRKWI